MTGERELRGDLNPHKGITWGETGAQAEKTKTTLVYHGLLSLGDQPKTETTLVYPG